jgi:PAS domain S-box-containing protein
MKCSLFTADGLPLSTGCLSQNGLKELLLFCDGQPTLFNIKRIPVILTEGSHGYANILTDITEKKRMEEELQETNEYLRNLFNYASTPIIVWDPEFRIIRFNYAFEHLTGRTEEEVLGQPLDILFPAVSRDASLALIKRTLEGEHWESVEIPIISTDGSVQTVLWNSANVLGRDGKIISTIAQGVDITEHKLAERNLRESEEKYRMLFENMLDGFAYCRMVYDSDGHPEDLIYLNVNRAFDRIIGIKNVTGKRFTEVFPGIGLTYPELFVIYGRVALTGIPESFEIDFKPIEKWLHISVYSPAQEYFVAVFEDITDRKRIEAALKHNEEKYRHLVETMNEGLLAVDKNCNITFVNNRYCEIVGYSLDELIGKPAVMLNAPEYTDVAQNQWAMRMRGNSGSYPISVIRKDGQKINTLVAARPVYDENGQLDGSLIVVTNLTPLEKTSL